MTNLAWGFGVWIISKEPLDVISAKNISVLGHIFWKEPKTKLCNLELEVKFGASRSTLLKLASAVFRYTFPERTTTRCSICLWIKFQAGVPTTMRVLIVSRELPVSPDFISASIRSFFVTVLTLVVQRVWTFRVWGFGFWEAVIASWLRFSEQHLFLENLKRYLQATIVEQFWLQNKIWFIFFLPKTFGRF